MHALTADGCPMTTAHPFSGVEDGHVWLQDIRSLDETSMPWQGYPFGDDGTAVRVLATSQDLTFQVFTTLFTRCTCAAGAAQHCLDCVA
jgi:hypothetical protein